jgi:hypothetical protein
MVLSAGKTHGGQIRRRSYASKKGEDQEPGRPTAARPFARQGASPALSARDGTFLPFRLLRGRCRVRIEVFPRQYREAVVLCPNCGEGGTLTNARREAGLREAHKLLSIMLRGADRQATKGREDKGRRLLFASSNASTNSPRAADQVVAAGASIAGGIARRSDWH